MSFGCAAPSCPHRGSHAPRRAVTPGRTGVAPKRRRNLISAARGPVFFLVFARARGALRPRPHCTRGAARLRGSGAAVALAGGARGKGEGRAVAWIGLPGRTSPAAAMVRVEGAECQLPIAFGTVAFYMGKKATENNSHKWTVYLRGAGGEDVDLSHVVSKVVFGLHPSFKQPQRGAGAARKRACVGDPAARHIKRSECPVLARARAPACSAYKWASLTPSDPPISIHMRARCGSNSSLPPARPSSHHLALSCSDRVSAVRGDRDGLGRV